MEAGRMQVTIKGSFPYPTTALFPTPVALAEAYFSLFDGHFEDLVTMMKVEQVLIEPMHG